MRLLSYLIMFNIRPYTIRRYFVTGHNNYPDDFSISMQSLTIDMPDCTLLVVFSTDALVNLRMYERISTAKPK
jgi:hypothetical protein